MAHSTEAASSTPDRNAADSKRTNGLNNEKQAFLDIDTANATTA